MRNIFLISACTPVARMDNFILGFKHMFAIERQDLLKFSHDDDDEDKRQAGNVSSFIETHSSS